MNTDKLLDLARKGDTGAIRDHATAGGDLHVHNERGDGLLLLAVYHGRLDTARFLLDAGIDVDVRNNNGQRPLTGACFKGFKPLVELLLDRGAQVHEPIADMKTPLMYAASYEHLGIVKLLLEHGADAAAKVDGKTALDYARENLAHDVVPFLESLAG